MKGILLIDPNEIKPPIPPLGLEYIAESLINADYEVDLGIFSEGDFERRFRDKLRDNRYFAVGISIRNIDYTVIQHQDFFLTEIERLVSKIRNLSDTPVIVGGAGFSIQPREILEYVGADFGVAGCGVPALEFLLRKLEIGGVQRGTVIKHEPEKYLDIGFKRNILDLKQYQKQGGSIGVSTKSGCNQRCIYCTYPIVSGYKIRLRNPSRVLEELKNLVDQGISRIFFADSVFNIPEEHAKSICDRITEKGLPINWEAYLTPIRRHFSKDLVDSMVRSGLVNAYLGIDSGSGRMLRMFRKGFSSSDIEYATKLCKERGLKVGFSILFGAPGESKETIGETFNLIDRLEPDYVDIQTAIRIYNSTEMVVTAKSEGLIVEPKNLLRPIFYPFKLIDHVYKETEKRDNCHICPT